jgi:hypothetical protein
MKKEGQVVRSNGQSIGPPPEDRCDAAVVGSNQALPAELVNRNLVVLRNAALSGQLSGQGPTNRSGNRSPNWVG